MKTIAQRIKELDDQLENECGSYIDYDGTLKWFETNLIVNLVAEREMLDEISNLKKLSEGWKLTMHFGHCPCPGITRDRCDQEYHEDPMGDMMGVNF